jgi:hypothetical protein
MDELRAAGRRLRNTRKAADDAYEAARLVALAGIADGVPQAVAARELGVDRMTIRKWMGKR